MRTRILLLLSALLMAAGLAAPATASATTNGTLGPCSNSWLYYCVGAQTVTLSTASPKCTPFSNGMEYQSATDANGVGQFWTYSNGGNACVQVNYAMPLNSDNLNHACYFNFYVPDNGYADADITFGWWDNTGTKHYAHVVNEAPASGWTPLYMNGTNTVDPAQAVNVTKIQFQDNNGQTPGSSVIGWGTPASYGISELC